MHIGSVRADVRHVHQIFFKAMDCLKISPAGDISYRCSRALPGAHSLGGRRLPASHSAYFLAAEIPLIAPFLKICFGSVRQKDLPCLFKTGASFVEGHGRTALMFTGMRARIEATVPFPMGLRRAGCPCGIAIEPACTSHSRPARILGSLLDHNGARAWACAIEACRTASKQSP